MKIENVLKANDIQFELIDICTDTSLREEMREKMGDPTAIPPQIFNGDNYCGVSIQLLRVNYFRLTT